MGALHNWVKLQNEYDCYFFIADLHALTTDYADTGELKRNIREIALDFLSAGLGSRPLRHLSPVRHVRTRSPHYPLRHVHPPSPGWSAFPTYKDQQEQMAEKELNTFGFLGYPLLQSADILLYKPDFVPVGADQVAHVELTREVARRFNDLYPGEFILAPESKPWEMPAILETARKNAGELKDSTRNVFTTHQLFQAAQGTKKLTGFSKRAILPEPQPLLTPSPKLPGLDGRKMSKSYKNTIMLSEPEVDLREKMKTMVTDPARVRRTDPGDPDKCPVGDLHKVFSDPETLAKVYDGCTTAAIGCIECKSWCADAIVRFHCPYSGSPARSRDSSQGH